MVRTFCFKQSRPGPSAIIHRVPNSRLHSYIRSPLNGQLVDLPISRQHKAEDHQPPKGLVLLPMITDYLYFDLI